MTEKPNLLLARVLMTVAAHGIAAGELLEATESTIQGLAADGAVDPHPDAVAYAMAQGAPVVRSAVELEAEAERARADAQAAEAAELERSLQATRDAAGGVPLAGEVGAQTASEPAPEAPAGTQAEAAPEAPAGTQAAPAAEAPAQQPAPRARRG